MATKAKKAQVAETKLNDAELAQIEAAMTPALSPLEEAQLVGAGEIVTFETGETEAQAQAQDAAAPEMNAAQDEAAGAGNFLDLVAGVDQAQAEAMGLSITTEFAERARFEKDANPANSNIQKTLAKLIRAYDGPNMRRALVVLGVSAGHINETELGTKRRNVYALDKIRDVIYGAVTGHLKNAINLACITSLFKLETAQVAFTGKVALACASDKVAVDAQLKSLLKRHTVAEATASTQASSTMTALEVLGVVKNTGTRNFPIYVLQDTPLTRRLRDLTKGGAATA